MIQKMLIDNALGVLTKDYAISMMHVRLSVAPSLPDFSNVFALYLVFGYPIGSSHAVCMFKKGGSWIFGDNEVGLLHTIKDPEFPNRFYEGLRTREGQENLAYVLSKDRKTSSSSMIGYLCANNVHYPPEFGKWGLGFIQPFIECVVMYQEKPPSAGGGHRRATRRRQRS
jgi:hypothetical protein